jgi:hypothetical protein
MGSWAALSPLKLQTTTAQHGTAQHSCQFHKHVVKQTESYAKPEAARQPKQQSTAASHRQGTVGPLFAHHRAALELPGCNAFVYRKPLGTGHTAVHYVSNSLSAVQLPGHLLEIFHVGFDVACPVPVQSYQMALQVQATDCLYLLLPFPAWVAAAMHSACNKGSWLCWFAFQMLTNWTGAATSLLCSTHQHPQHATTATLHATQ